MCSLPSTPLALRAAIALALTILGCGWAATRASTVHAGTPQCTYVAAPHGSDAAPGTAAQPFSTPQRLVDKLGPGETGCLRRGTYTQDLAVRHGGRGAAPLTLRSYPGERARLVGRLYIARRADRVTVSDLDLIGVEQGNACGAWPCPSPTVNAAHATFRRDDVTNDHTAICFSLGADSWGAADDATIADSRIHDCGILPARNRDHGIYANRATGVRILRNVIADNADKGIVFFPQAHDSYVADNVIDGNGEGVNFGALGSLSSNGNVVEHNLITNSRKLYNVQSYYGPNDTIGVGNVVRENCIGGGVRDDAWNPGGIARDRPGFSVGGNTLAVPRFVDRARGDFRLTPRSPCQGILRAGGPGLPYARAPRAAPRVTLRASQPSVRRGRSLLVIGSGRGARIKASGRRATLSRLRSGRWRAVSRARVARDGGFRIRLRVSRRRSARELVLRAAVPGIGRSNRIRVTISR